MKATTEAKWHYRSQDGDAGLNKNPARLKDLGEHTIAIFIREVIQNNLDAALNSDRVIVEIKIDEWGKENIDQFINIIGYDHIDRIEKSSNDTAPAVAAYLREALQTIKQLDESSYAVTVEEKNCFGLTGPVRQSPHQKSHFDALMRKVENNEAKEKETTNTGGTWGKGSSIFTYTSKLWMWFSYTQLSQPWNEENDEVHETRFIGRSMIAPYFDEEQNKSFLGDCWFCDTKKFETLKLDAFPLINETADRYATLFGLNKRSEPGTTFFIPFFKPLLENENEVISLSTVEKEFIDQVVKNWYITIYSEKLEVHIVTKHSRTIINQAYLHRVKELQFKLQILNWYSQDCPPDPRFKKEIIEIEVPSLKSDFRSNKEFASKRQMAKSDLLIRIINEDEDFEDNWETVNKTALCRNKGMLVTNEPMLATKTIRTESILLTGLLSKSELSIEKGKHLDLFIGYSENPAHNYWARQASDYNICFLERFEKTRFKPETSIRKLFEKMHRVFKELLGEEKENANNKDICSLFKKLARLNNKGGDVGGPTIFSMRNLGDSIDENGRHIFKRKIVSNLEATDLEVSFKSYIESLDGDKDRDFDTLGIPEFGQLEILNDNGDLITSSDLPKIKIHPGEQVVIKLRTCSIENNLRFKNLEPFIKTTAKEIINE